MLDTTEILETHTTQHLLTHIENVLTWYEISDLKNDNITVIFNSTSYTDIHEQDEEVPYGNNNLEQEQDNPEVNIELSVDENDRDRLNSISDQQPVTPSAGIAPPTGHNASDIHKALETLGKYEWVGCAGYHTNLIAQAGFKNVQSATRIVRKCKKIVEHIKHSTNSTNMLITYQKQLELPLLKVLQENSKRWWAILIMLEKLLDIAYHVNAVLAYQGKTYLLINERDQNDMQLIVDLLTTCAPVLRPYRTQYQIKSSKINGAGNMVTEAVPCGRFK